MNQETDAFIAKVGAFIEQRRLLGAADRILVAVSGGADSVALLLALRHTGCPLEVAHFDHQTRQGASQADARFVATLAAKLGLPFHYDSAPVEIEARMHGRSLESHARDRRYAFFLQTARARGCSVIATGHHRDDQAETVLMRLIRGAGPTGAAGIPDRRLIGDKRLIRPLLCVTRQEITAWLESRQESWRDDVTNQDTHFLRNRVRHSLLPELRRHYNQQIRGALSRFAEAQRCDHDLLEKLTEEALAQCLEDTMIGREAFRRQHPALQRRIIMGIAWRQGLPEIPYDRTLAAVEFIAQAATGRRFDLGQGLVLYNGRRHTQILDPDAGAPVAPEEEAVLLRVPGRDEALGYTFEARILTQAPPRPFSAYCTPQRQIFDAEVMSDGVAVRTRRSGDRFTPLGMNGVKKLSDYFIDIGLAEPQRDTVPILLAGDRIVWIVGHAIAAHAAVGPFTRRILEITVHPPGQP